MADELSDLPGGVLDGAQPSESADGQGDDAPKEDSPSESDNDIVSEAKTRFNRAQTWESVARQRWLDDLKFAEADSENQYQWPNEIRRARDIDERPCLTINKTRQHNMQIINEAKQNKPSIKIRATGGGASVQSAKVYNALMRQIEYASKAQNAYDTATQYQVKCGIGWLRIITDYEDSDSFNQVPKIMRVWDPLTIYIDTDCKETDKSDARWGFVFEEMDDKQFKEKWPQYEDYMTNQTLDEAFGWRKENSVRLAEYYRKTEVEDTLYAIPGAQGMVQFRKSELEKVPQVIEKLESMPNVKKRETTLDKVEYYTILGSTIIDRGIWIGKFIPLIPVIGEETIIEGELDRKGHTRALRDPQRMYNYGSSIAVEYSSLQSKSPYIAPAEAIEGLEEYWSTANKINYSVLPYNGKADDGTDIPPPQRQQPPVPMPAALQMMETASNEMMMASGQYEAEFGQKSNERSAKAINERERASGTSTYHFVDNLATAIRFAGLQIMDLIPKLYDTPRIMMIMAEDGTAMEMQLDPQAKQAVMMAQQGDAESAQQILFNPNVGKYDVQADVGPDWGTKRRENFEALTTILTQAPQLVPIIGDLLLGSSDFEMATEAAARMKRMVPPEALGQGPSQQVQAMKSQIDQLGEMLKETMGELAKEKIKLKGKDALRQVDVYKAVTARITAVSDAAVASGKALSPEDLSMLMNQIMEEARNDELSDVMAATDPTLKFAAQIGNSKLMPPAGARRAPDGNFYVQNGQNQFARVQPQ